MSPRLDNTSPAADPRRATYFSWDEFDRLPRLFRDLMNYTPINVGTGYVWSQLAAGMDLEYVAHLAVKRWRRYAKAAALRDYGPDHPQAA